MDIYVGVWVYVGVCESICGCLWMCICGCVDVGGWGKLRCE